MSGDQSISQRKFSVLFRKICCEQSKFYLVCDSYPRTGCLNFLTGALSACSVIPFKGACALKWDAPLSADIEYNSSLIHAALFDAYFNFS